MYRLSKHRGIGGQKWWIFKKWSIVFAEWTTDSYIYKMQMSTENNNDKNNIPCFLLIGWQTYGIVFQMRLSSVLQVFFWKMIICNLYFNAEHVYSFSMLCYNFLFSVYMNDNNIIDTFKTHIVETATILCLNAIKIIIIIWYNCRCCFEKDNNNILYPLFSIMWRRVHRQLYLEEGHFKNKIHVFSSPRGNHLPHDSDQRFSLWGQRKS